MNYLERHHLEILSALAKEGTLSRAAETLSLSQPALTHSIRRLEDQLGLQVWERQGRKVVLNRTGGIILKYADQILARFHKLEEELQNQIAGVSSVLNIGVECHPCYQWLLKALGLFLAGHPGTDTRIIREFQFAAMEALIHHKIDLLITPDPYDLGSLQFHPLRRYELRLALPADHPLAAYEYLEPQHLAGVTLLTYPVEITRLDVYTRFLIPAGIPLPQRREVDSHEMMLLLVEANRGLSVIPDWLVTESSQITTRPLGSEGLFNTLWAGIRREDQNRQDIRDFIAITAEV